MGSRISPDLRVLVYHTGYSSGAAKEGETQGQGGTEVLRPVHRHR